MRVACEAVVQLGRPERLFRGGEKDMEYGLRRYEAAQRLTWFMFFLVCLMLAYPVAGRYHSGYAETAQCLRPIQPEALKSPAFWTEFRWVHVQPLGKLMTYLAMVAVIFLVGKLLWLVIQFVGEFLIERLLSQKIGRAQRARSQIEKLPTSAERAFPADSLMNSIDHLPLRLIFHPYQRMKLLLSRKPQGTLSSEDLMEKERRIVESDWQILYSSWAPFKWLLWFLPVFALIQAGWLLYVCLQPALTGQKELQEIFGTVLNSFVPLVQVIGLAIVFKLASGLLRRIEDLYLSNVDAMLFDRFISQVPFQSSDTVVLLDALQRQFNEIHAALRRLERSIGGESRASGE